MQLHIVLFTTWYFRYLGGHLIYLIKSVFDQAIKNRHSIIKYITWTKSSYYYYKHINNKYHRLSYVTRLELLLDWTRIHWIKFCISFRLWIGARRGGSAWVECLATWLRPQLWLHIASWEWLSGMTWRDLQRPLGELECGGCPGVTTSQLTARKWGTFLGPDSRNTRHYII